MWFPTPRRGVGVVCALAFVAVTMTDVATEAATIVVAAGGDLQSAIDAAQPGDVITLAPGATYVGNFVLRNKGTLTTPIVIRSAAADGLLPGPGIRMTPASAALLPKIKSPNSASALRTDAGAHHWTLMFLEFQANLNGYGEIIGLGAGDSTQTQWSQVPYALVIDRVYIHGDPALGQKRGIAMHSRDTLILNSYVSDCKAIGQDAQAIGGFNGPGNYLIENNYLEGAAENVLFGGADPAIPNLVTTNIVFRHNHLRKPLEWRNPILPTITGAAATPIPAGGVLAAGTYAYRISGRRLAGQVNVATSAASPEVAVTLSAAGAITLSWTPMPGAQDYIIYGRTPGGQSMYWKSTSPYFTDTGAAGASGTPAKGTKWSVKNLFELKNTQDVLVEGNVMENLWVADQSGYAVAFTPRNQDHTAPWVVVQRVMFRHNLVRHTAGGMNILGHDNEAPSQQTNHLTIQNNLFDDMTAATWGAQSRFVLLGGGADSITIDHNTVLTTDSAIMTVYGGTATAPMPSTSVVYTNNMSPHNTYGIFGDNFGTGLVAIAAYLPAGIVTRNVLAGGSSAKYPANNFFPTVAAWQGEFVDFAAGDYRLAPSSLFKNAGTDGTDLGADVAVVMTHAAVALSGNNAPAPVSRPVQILTTELPHAMYGQAYAQTLSCSGGSGPCAWQLQTASLPTGLGFDPRAALISGTPADTTTGSITVTAYDPAAPGNATTATLALAVDPPVFVVSIPPVPKGQVNAAYQIAPSVAGGLGTVSWLVSASTLPPGLGLDSRTGVISGVPSAWGTWTFVLQAEDSWASGRVDAKPVTVTVAPMPLSIVRAALPDGVYDNPYGTAALRTAGGTGAASWALTAGALPSGMTLDTNGSIYGRPVSAGTFTFSVRAVDTNWPEYQAADTFTLNIAVPPLTATFVGPAALAQVGQPYQASVPVTGALNTITWSIVSGSLPPGLALNTATGGIAGVPATAGAFTAVIGVADAYAASRSATVSLSISVLPAATASAREVVLYAKDATRIAGTWSRVADPAAAGGYSVANPDAGAAKLTTALAAPANYFELTFQADARVPYHLWIRGKADADSYSNDSLFVQFSQSVDAGGAAVNRIGTAAAAAVSIEDGSGAGLSGWGWQDNGYGTFGEPVYFAASGLQTIRIQLREDGLAVDQIVLSAATYSAVAPGKTKSDQTIVPKVIAGTPSPEGTPREVVLYASDATVVKGRWSRVADSSAAGGFRLSNLDAGTPKLAAALPAPADYFELTFKADAGVPYHLWLRGRADQDSYSNDSVFVQFSGSNDAAGVGAYRIGSSTATPVSIEDGSGAGLAGWGWQDNAYGLLADPIYFAQSGDQTIRVQSREDGISIDQIVISAVKYLSAAPGARKNDTTVLQK